MPHADAEVRRAYNRRRYQENRDEIIAKVAAWRADNPERSAESKKAWREANPEKMAEHQKRWYLANKEKQMERARIARQRRLEEDPIAERARQCEKSARHRAKRAKARVEKVDRQVVWERDKGICGICGLPVDPVGWNLDHIVAIARGGEHSYANVQVSHARCNKVKAAS